MPGLFYQMVDRLVVQVQDATKALSMGDSEAFQTDIDQASSVVKDADNSKQVMRERERQRELKRIIIKKLGFALQPFKLFLLQILSGHGVEHFRDCRDMHL